MVEGVCERTFNIRVRSHSDDLLSIGSLTCTDLPPFFPWGVSETIEARFHVCLIRDGVLSFAWEFLCNHRRTVLNDDTPVHFFFSVLICLTVVVGDVGLGKFPGQSTQRGEGEATVASITAEGFQHGSELVAPTSVVTQSNID